MSLSEQYIQDAFHSYLKSSLTQAKIEHLLDADILASAEADLMITGPALCLYFAALRCTTNPPSVPLPRHDKTSHRGGQQVQDDLSLENCPPAFRGFLSVWAKTVPKIQSLSPEYQHDLARIICGLGALIQPGEPALGGVAADLRAVAIEISQRRSFQDRYAQDLQAALDAGNTTTTTGGTPGAEQDETGHLKVKASFVPPPSYDVASSPASSSPRSPGFPIPHSPSFLNPHSPHGHHSTASSPPYTPSHSRTPSNTSHLSTSPSSPSFLTSTPSIQLIRETLYAALGDVLSSTPSLLTLLTTDQPRAYFASVAFAILRISTTNITSSGSVIGVLGQELTLAECPRDLKPFMMELAAIGRQAKQFQDEDDQVAMDCAVRGIDVPGPGKLERTKMVLEGGIGFEHRRDAPLGEEERDERRRSIEGNAVAFANKINGLALGMTRLRAFRERQDEIFKVLAGVGRS